MSDRQILIPPNSIPSLFWLDDREFKNLTDARHYLIEEVGFTSIDAMRYIKSLPVTLD